MDFMEGGAASLRPVEIVALIEGGDSNPQEKMRQAEGHRFESCTAHQRFPEETGASRMVILSIPRPFFQRFSTESVTYL